MRVRGVIGIAAVFVRADMAVQQPEFVVLHQTVGVLQVGLAGPDRLYLGTGKNHSRLKFFQQEVVVAGVPINGGISFPGGGGLAGVDFSPEWNASDGWSAWS